MASSKSLGLEIIVGPDWGGNRMDKPLPFEKMIWEVIEPLYGYGSIPIDTFLGGWTFVYQLFWGSPGVQGFDTLPSCSSWILGLEALEVGWVLISVKVGFWTGEDRKSTSQNGDLRFLEGRGWGWYTIYCIILYLYIYIYHHCWNDQWCSEFQTGPKHKKSRPSGSWAWHVAGFVEFGPVPTKIDIFQMHNLGSLQIFQVTTCPRIHGCSHPHYSFLHLCWKPISNIVVTLW